MYKVKHRMHMNPFFTCYINKLSPATRRDTRHAIASENLNIKVGLKIRGSYL